MANKRKVMKGKAFSIVRGNERTLLYYFLRKLNLPIPVNRMHEIITKYSKTISK